MQLDSWPAALDHVRLYDLENSPSRSISGFAFVGNTVGTSAAGGKSSKGVIAHNRFFNLMGLALQMSPEYYWAEADSVSGVLVLGNIVNSYGPGVWLGGSPQVRFPAPHFLFYFLFQSRVGCAKAALTSVPSCLRIF